MTRLIQVRWVGGAGEHRRGDVRLSSDVPFESADALLCTYRPDPELIHFERTRAWHCTEPFTNRQWGAKKWSWNRVGRRLAACEILGHGASCEQSWLPPPTHWWPLSVLLGGARERRVVGVASNYGWYQLRKTPEIAARNRFLTNPLTDLYGRERHWNRYRERPWSRPGPPSNYIGELPGDISHPAKRQAMSRYQVAIALENTFEPFYFTEKFLGAVEAGCIPVYHAHPTVEERYLQGARWVDPEDFGWDVDATVHHALAQPRDEYAEQNRMWLESGVLAETSYKAVRDKTIDELARRIASAAV